MTPDGWRRVRLADVTDECKDRNGDRLGGERLFAVTKAEGMVPMRDRVKGQDFNRCKVVRPGAFAYNPMRLNIGSIARWAGERDVMVSPDYVVFKCDPDQLDDSFLDQYRQSTAWTRFMEDAGKGSVRVRIYYGNLAELELPLPPLPEQRKIAAILGSVDEAIRATQAVIDQTRTVKQGLLQELLTRGIGHTRFKQTEIGEVPEVWEVRALEDVVPPDQPITYGIVQAGPHVEDGVPYIRVSDMSGSELTTEDMLRTAPEIAARYSRSMVRPGDLVFALRGKIGHVLPVPEVLDGANLTQGTARISPGANVLPAFLLWAMRSSTVLEQILLAAKGSTFKEISLSSLRRIWFPIPPADEQAKIVELVAAADAAERSAEQEREALLRLKDGLMQNLLTGRVRVNPDA